MSKLYDAAVEVQTFCQQHGWRACVIGGLAVIRWGEHRATKDVDFSLLCDLGAEASRIDPLLQRFTARIPDAAEFANLNRVVLLFATNGTPIDIGLAGFPFEEEIIARATSFRFTPTVNLTTCSAEDLIVLKALAGRPHDWVDIEGVLIKNADLDWTYLQRKFASLAELSSDTDLLNEVRRIQAKVADP
jgi:hypothetical protein